MLQNPFKHTHNMCSETSIFCFHQHFKSRFSTNIIGPKSKELKCKHKKTAHETFVRKSVGEINHKVGSIFINSLKLNKIWDTNNCPSFLCGL
jgi:hypothetical protein